MEMEKTIAGFIGAGGIARVHAFSLRSLPFYYEKCPEVVLESVCSFKKSSREAFAHKYGFRLAQTPEEFFNNRRINTVFILGPNNVHYEHLKYSLEMPGVRKIYLEKPVCASFDEEQMIADLVKKHPDVIIQVGFQYLFSTHIRDSITFWKTSAIGDPIHFDVKYFHGDYLRADYRSKRKTRLSPAPDGGAMADLGSHAISILIAFLGDKIQITSALQAGHFNDVPEESDLFSLINIFDPVSQAAGTVSASRISSGTGDLISLELYGDKGAIKFSTHSPQSFEYYLEQGNCWNKVLSASDYRPDSGFPSVHVPPGWTRSMIHGHYVFLTGINNGYFVPDILHGLAVQKLVRQTAEHISDYRNQARKIHKKNL
jgi:predicted dehydrogenase